MEPLKIKSFFALACLILLVGTPASKAATSTLNSAKVTQIQNSVLLQEGQPPANTVERPATVGDMVVGTRTLVTGKQSRAELLFNDDTIARLGANSVFSFKPGSRDIDLKSGFLLLHTPKGHGGAKITTPTAAASVLGTTIMMSALPDGGMKLVVLEGTASITQNGITQLVGAGQLVFITKEQGMSPPINIDLSKLVASSGLMNNLTGSIGSENLINEAISFQTEQIADGQLENSGIVIGGDQNGLNVVNDNSTLQQALEDLTDLSVHQNPADSPPETTSIFEVNSTSVIDYSNPDNQNQPTLTTGDQTIPGTLIGPGEFEGGQGDVFFIANGFHITGGPPIEVNSEGVNSLNFFAWGEILGDQSPSNSILFENFIDDNEGGGGGGDGIHNLNFYAMGGGLSILDSLLTPKGHLGLVSYGIEGQASNVLVQNSTVGPTDGGLRDMYVGAFGGDISINNSSLTTSQTYADFGEAGFGEIGGSDMPAGLTLEAFGGNVGISNNSILKHLVQVTEQFGEGFFDGEIGGITIAANDGRTEIRDSQILTQSDIGPSGVSIGDPLMGSNSYVLIDHSAISSAIGASAAAIGITANRIDLVSANISAVSESGAAQSVSLIANTVNLTDSVIHASTITLGNPSNPGTAQINFTGANVFYTQNGSSGDVQYQGIINGPLPEIRQNPTQGGGGGGGL